MDEFASRSVGHKRLINLLFEETEGDFVSRAVLTSDLSTNCRLAITLIQSSLASIDATLLQGDIHNLTGEALDEIQTYLERAGILEDDARIASLCVLADRFRKSGEEIPPDACSPKRLVEWLVMRALGPTFAGVELSLAESLARAGKQLSSPNCREILLILDSVRAGRAGGEIPLLGLVLPMYKGQTNSVAYVEHLGWLYDLMCKHSEVPEVAAVLAEFIYHRGHAGEESDALELAARAALAGNEYAWELLGDWLRNGNAINVIQALQSNT